MATVRVYVYQSNDGNTIALFGTMAEAEKFQREQGVPDVEIMVETYVSAMQVSNVEVLDAN